MPDAYATIFDLDQKYRLYSVRCEVCAAAPSSPCFENGVVIEEVHFVRAVHAGGGHLDKGADRDRTMAERASWCTKSPRCRQKTGHIGDC